MSSIFHTKTQRTEGVLIINFVQTGDNNVPKKYYVEDKKPMHFIRCLWTKGKSAFRKVLCYWCGIEVGVLCVIQHKGE